MTALLRCQADLIQPDVKGRTNCVEIHLKGRVDFFQRRMALPSESERPMADAKWHAENRRELLESEG